jgi:hypothetical protein
MPATKTDSDKKWQPKPNHKWHSVPVDKATGSPTPEGEGPFDPDDPESEWGANIDGKGHLVVPCGDGIQVNWQDLFPPAPQSERHHHTSGDSCKGGVTEVDVQVEITEREVWFRDYRCSFVVQTSMTWKITKQKWRCQPEGADDLGELVGPNLPGTWVKDGGPIESEVSKSRKTEFKCC